VGASSSILPRRRAKNHHYSVGDQLGCLEASLMARYGQLIIEHYLRHLGGEGANEFIASACTGKTRPFMGL